MSPTKLAARFPLHGSLFVRGRLVWQGQDHRVQSTAIVRRQPCPLLEEGKKEEGKKERREERREERKEIRVGKVRATSR